MTTELMSLEKLMAKTIYTPKDIFDQEFKTSMRGFDRKEVDEFLDNVIKDYETLIGAIEELKAENARLKEAAKQPSTSDYSRTAQAASHHHQTATTASSATNFDILKRISRLEKEVFGKQIIG